MLNSYSMMNPLFKIFNSTLVKLPAPSNLTLYWNFGSLLSISLLMQMISGLFLASTYSSNIMFSFELMSKVMENTDKGWLIRYLHANGASLFFMAMYIHIGRGVYYSSYLYRSTWNVGVTILLLSMATAFMGYVLPASQMSFWGASVITNLFTEVPYIGSKLVHLIWGGLSVGTPTIMRFFTFHFILPFIILTLVLIHITFLHLTGSSNPLGLKSNFDKIIFHSYFSFKDMVGLLITIFMFLLLCLMLPNILGDDENFVMANSSVTPIHIQPEWYFLFAYAILRSIPNKLGGVVALILSVTILYLLPFSFISNMKSLMFYPLNKMLFWSFLTTIMLLTWIGMRPIEAPYMYIGQTLTIMYFSFYLMNPILMKLWDKII